MQTFLPSKSFRKSAKLLDYRRLGKQRVEAMQILNILLSNKQVAWRNHPAVLQWKGYEGSLFAYLCAMSNEWSARGYKNEKIAEYINSMIDPSSINFNLLGETYNKPSWLGSKKYHDSHKSKLLQKNPTFYSQFNWKVPQDLEYFWPVTKNSKGK